MEKKVICTPLEAGRCSGFNCRGVNTVPVPDEETTVPIKTSAFPQGTDILLDNPQVSRLKL